MDEQTDRHDEAKSRISQFFERAYRGKEEIKLYHLVGRNSGYP